MNELYYFTENGNGAYIEGYEGDNIYNPNTCLLVTKRPTNGGYVWDTNSEAWILTMTSQQNYIRRIRNLELARTDKYVLPDYPLTAEQVEGAKTYRQTLRDVPDKLDPAEMVMPQCPSYLDPIP